MKTNKLSPALVKNAASSLTILVGLGFCTGAVAKETKLDEVVVIAPTPSALGLGIAAERLPFAVQSVNAETFARTQSADITDYLTNNMGSVSANSAQSNPLQPDIQFRGFVASPLLGLPMGVSVYQNGVRVNEPLSDAVNWDLLPESAIQSMTLIGGANPLFGLNTLGGALAIKMKDGFSYVGQGGEISSGSYGRVMGHMESGGNNGTFGYYINVGNFDEDGWRDLSPSSALNGYGAVSWHGEKTQAHFGYQYADTDLTGNGTAPVGLLALDRNQVFTAPDTTQNQLHGLTFDLTYAFSDQLSLGGNLFYRDTKTDSFNGDGSEYSLCHLRGGNYLLEGIDEHALADLNLNGEQTCKNNILNANDPTELEAQLNGLAGNPTAFHLEDLGPELSGTGRLADDAINNISTREQEAFGGDTQVTWTRPLFSRTHYFVLGTSIYVGQSDFAAQVELADLDPQTRSTQGLGTGTFVDELEVDVKTSTRTASLYFMDNLELTETITTTVGGRFNDTHVRLRDQSGERRELNGDHDFRRLNPALGITWITSPHTTLYANYSESSRTPTPIELACNEGVFEVARQIAIEDGENPDDIEFECRLPNAFLADPPLNQVVAKSIEAGLRGKLAAQADYRLGVFHTENHDDIIFQSTGRSTGLFANVDKTQREGLELSLSGNFNGFIWLSSYSYVAATFASPFMVLSPNHPNADANGELPVKSGDRIPGIPNHQFKFGGDYAFASGLSLGFEFLYNANQYLRGDEANQLDPLDGYSLINLRSEYQLTSAIEIFGKVTNVLNTNYENFGLIGEDPTEIIPELSDASPYYLGAGAPRGAWLGFRARI